MKRLEFDVPTLSVAEDREAIESLLRDLQRAVMLHPEAARALFSALVAEGRVFAQTRDGAAWRERILRSKLVERSLLVWQTATSWMLEEPGDGTAPSALIDAVASAASSSDRDLILDRLFRSMEDADVDPG